MKKRSFPSRPGIWRQRFVQIARQMDALGDTPAAAALGLKPRAARLGAALRSRTPQGRLAA